jgi:transcription initiation factor TFIID subunit 10
MSNTQEEQFIGSLQDFTPLIPDEIVDFYLKQTGFNCPDQKMTRLIALAAQKFLSDIVHETRQYHDKSQSTSGPKKKVILTMEHLQKTLDDYGINTRKQEYFVDAPAGSRQ